MSTSNNKSSLDRDTLITIIRYDAPSLAEERLNEMSMDNLLVLKLHIEALRKISMGTAPKINFQIQKKAILITNN